MRERDYLWFRTEDAIKKTVVELVDVHYPHVKLFQAPLNDSSFDLDILLHQS